MTIEEAIKILTPNDSKSGLVRAVDGFLPTYEVSDALEMAAFALRAQQTPAKLDRSRWEGCPVCATNGCETCIYTYCGKNECPCCDCSRVEKYEPDGFCPSCGRPLTKEAWAELERRIGGNNDN